jgi:hypothetical protein
MLKLLYWDDDHPVKSAKRATQTSDESARIHARHHEPAILTEPCGLLKDDESDGSMVGRGTLVRRSETERTHGGRYSRRRE